LLGKQQSGAPRLRFGDLAADAELVERAATRWFRPARDSRATSPQRIPPDPWLKAAKSGFDNRLTSDSNS